ncbi:hypothetical protein [Streptomyces sp. NPDC020983]|uniref:hypothetical protein n=1 Tax=Streptomyces sp. NPDC020983 TaxID=3365106 RepID=UPI0037A2ECB4
MSISELVKNALSTAGAYCGECGFELGDRNKCRACERCLDIYARVILPLLDTSAERVPVLLAELGQKTTEVERLKVEHDRELGQLIDERDNREEWADELANAVGPIELIGEHSSHNNPWANALDLITPHAQVQKLRGRVAELEAERHATNEALDDAVKAIREKDQRIAELQDELTEQRRYAAALEAAVCQCQPVCEDGEYMHEADCPVVPIQMEAAGLPKPDVKAGGPRV